MTNPNGEVQILNVKTRFCCIVNHEFSCITCKRFLCRECLNVECTALSKFITVECICSVGLKTPATIAPYGIFCPSCAHIPSHNLDEHGRTILRIPVYHNKL